MSEQLPMEYQPWMFSYEDCFSQLDSCSSLPQTICNNNDDNNLCITYSDNVSDNINNNNNNKNNDVNTNNSGVNNNSINNCNSDDTNTGSGGGGGEDESAVIKRLNHNARERDRRKNLNALYSSLRSLLPSSDHKKKKLSIAGTVSRVVKYIPEQRQEVDNLCRKKEEILNKISRKSNKRSMKTSESRIVPTWISDTEILLHFTSSSSSSDNITLSNLLLRLEEIGLRLISFSSLDSSTTWAFFTLHLEIDRNCKVKFEELSEMLMGLQDK